MSGLKKVRTGYELRGTWAVSGKREYLYLPQCTKRDAESVLTKIESIVARKRLGYSMLPEDAQWVNSIYGSSLFEKLASRGIIQHEAKAEKEPRTFLEVSDQYLIDHAGKETTKRQLKVAQRDALKVFGPTIDITSISVADAIAFENRLKRRGLAVATVRKKCSRVKQFFTHAVKTGLIASNPFDEVRTASIENTDRMVYVDASEVCKLIDSTDNPDLKMILLLTRFAGLRRHECSLLKWQDFDWRKRQITIRSNKTPAKRVAPIFKGELRERLLEVKQPKGRMVRWDAESQGSVSCLKKHCTKIGFDLWEKPFQNLRASLLTDLLETHPIKDVCTWLGNSEQVAMKHYAMARNENMRAAAGM